MKNFDEENFVEDEYTDWNHISIHETLSEQFIEKYSDKLNWINIFIHQNLSKKFIEKHKDKIDKF